MSVWSSHPTTTPLATAYASNFILFTAMGTAPLIFAWLADILPHDPEARTLIVGVAIAGYYAISAWSQVLVWPATQAPYCKFFSSAQTHNDHGSDPKQTSTHGSQLLPSVFSSLS